MIKLYSTVFLTLVVLVSACDQKKSTEVESVKNSNSWFVKLPSEETGLNFKNLIVEDQNRNVLLYEYFYNGGGVAVGDFNNDGNEDIFLTANQQSCKLYLNQGKWKFNDVTEKAGVTSRVNDWKTGAVAVDINADGLLDIYLCYSGPFAKEQRTNQLFINKGVDQNGLPHFIDEAKEYGLNDEGFTTHAAFIDYDRDGDLDAVLINHNPRRPENLNAALINEMQNKTSVMKGVRLYRNDNNKFKDATLASGIHNSELNFGLGVATSDVNQDGWPDIYFSNDYLVPDYLYINNGDGTFTDQAPKMLAHMAHFSMGNAVADINNDSRPDIITLDMLPEDNARQKKLFMPDNYAVFESYRELGLQAQFMRNMLQLNNGDGTFSEIGQLAGISNTDWSWAPLLVDFDNDGWKDLFISNGYLRDFTNLDFLKYMTKYFQENSSTIKKEDMINVVNKMPSSNVHDYMFQNEGGITFTDKSISWGFQEESNGNGASYADFDNDGDFDLIINTINGELTVYRNDASNYNKNKSVAVKLIGTSGNVNGIGSRLMVWCNGKVQLLEQMPSRGFQSSVSSTLIIGLGKADRLDSLKVSWPSGKTQMLFDVTAGQRLSIKEGEARIFLESKIKTATLFKQVDLIEHKHIENKVIDFKRQPLMLTAKSFSGPAIALGDVNDDGRNDLYIGGSSGHDGELYIQQQNGKYTSKRSNSLKDTKYEDTDALFVDVDKDGDLDLYVCSGGYDDFSSDDQHLQDRLYINDGKGNFERDEKSLPAMLTSTSCVRPADINHDGFVDLFVGGRVVPGRYPETPRSFILLNDGHGHFHDATVSINKDLEYMGMVTDAQWADMNSDGWQDLITAGEWMPIQVWINQNGKLTDRTIDYLSGDNNGWWNALSVIDLNKDGYLDLIAGNHGLNSQCKASAAQPFELYAKDFDANGSIDPILCMYIQGKSYPYASRDELLDQLPYLKKKFTDYESYSNATISSVFEEKDLKDAMHLVVNTFETKVFISNKSARLTELSVPKEVQFSPVYAIACDDFNGDGRIDILLAGNDRQARLRLGWYDANYGVLLEQNEKNEFVYKPQFYSGLSLSGDVRSIIVDKNHLIIGQNNAAVLSFKYTK